MAKKPKLKTVQMYHRWNAGKYALFTGTFACPVIPASIVTAVNWDEWFGQASYSLPFGFSCALVAVIVAILGVLGSDTVIKKKDIMLVWIATLLALIGASCLFLANLLLQMGWMWIYTGGGLLGSAICVSVEKNVVEPNVKMYKDLIAKNCLDAKSKRQRKREEQARKDAEEDAMRQAVE